MKHNKDNNSTLSLRAKLLRVFVIYGLVLLAVLWLLEIVLFGVYYKASMESKLNNGVESLSRIYSKSTELEYDSFIDSISEISANNDIIFYIQAEDDSFAISSSENTPFGRDFGNTKMLFADALKMLENSAEDRIQYVRPGDGGNMFIISARKIDSDYRVGIYMFAIALLTPVGPAVGILRSQLLIISAIVLVLAVVIALITSKRMAKPMVEMSKAASLLGKGNFDVTFEGADYQELNDLADTLNKATKELKESDNLQKDLMANVSHDLRTPLTMIKSYAEMIRDISGGNKKKREEHLGVIIEETDRLSDLVGDILELSKVQSGAEEFKSEPFSISKAAEEIFNTYKIEEINGFKLEFEPVGEDVLVRGDEHKIKQVISNLMSNAIKYSGDEKYVKLSIAVRGDKIRLSVLDRGIGIPEDELEKVWDRYQRASQRGVRSKTGTGLGLSICAEIIKRHGGTYGVESTLGEGSTFWFEI